MNAPTVKVRVRVCECGARYSTPGVAQMHKCPDNDGGKGSFRTVTETRPAEPSRISYQPGAEPVGIARECIGPRVVGGRYRSGYWRDEYLVTHVGIGTESRIPWSAWSITCKDPDGTERTHCTSWDPRRDSEVTP